LPKNDRWADRGIRAEGFAGVRIAADEVWKKLPRYFRDNCGILDKELFRNLCIFVFEQFLRKLMNLYRAFLWVESCEMPEG